MVYEAIDTRLNRRVAVKFLPDAFAKNPERLARFEREARLLATLNHTNIAAIHGLETTEGLHFLVLELVPGDTLAARLARGPMPIADALAVARQIGAGLEAAHASGIVHRDLKPGNVKVTPDGQVKVLDFGLAKAFERERPDSDLSRSPTVTGHHTHPDIILGTAAYMSPEQARGKQVDQRTDIWAFGCVLYETLTGRQAFPGETLSDSVAKILEREPDWSLLPAAAPRAVLSLLRRCLRKEVSRRLRDVGDAKIEIEDVLSGPPVEETALSASSAPRWRPSTTWGLLAAAATLAGIGFLVGRLMTRPAGRGTDAGPRLVQVARLTHDPGLSEWPTWSPDGSLLAFASDRGGNFDIYARRVEGGQDVNVTNDPSQDYQPAFSPDGKWLAFISTGTSRTGMIKIGATFGLEFRTQGGDLWLAPALGGQARRLAVDANFPTWSPDGRRIAYISGPEDHRSIMEIGTESGTPSPLLPSTESNSEIVRLQYSPNGKWLSFETVEGRVLLLPGNGGASRELVDATSHVWDPAGEHLYYLNRDPMGGTRLQFVEIDQNSGTVRASPGTLGLVTGILRHLAISGDGRDLAVSELEGSLNLTRLPLSVGGETPAGPEEILREGQVIDRYPSFSPDGRRIAFGSDRLGPEQIWILDLATKQQRPLELPGKDLGANLPYWSPDGRQLTLTRSFQGGTQSLWIVAVDGSHAEEILPPAPDQSAGPFSPDGKEIIYTTKSGEFLQLFAFDLAGRTSRQISNSRSDKYLGDWSPDGRWVVFSANAGGSMQAWRMPAGGGKEEPLTTGHERVRHAFYSPDGRRIYVQPSHRNIYWIPATGGSMRPVTSFPESGLFIEEPALAPDGRYLAYCRSNGGSSLWRLTIGDDPSRRAP